MLRPQLSIKQILEWADQHRKRTGRWPEAGSAGRVRGVPNEHWHTIDSCLRKGLRGLPAGGSLARLLAEHRGKSYRNALPKHTIQQILQWADAYHAQHGKWPKSNFGPVAGAEGEAWSAIDAALRYGTRGLPGGSSLAQLLAEERGVVYKPRLSVRRILAWADRHFERTGQWPRRNSGPVQEAAGESWADIDDALRQGSRTLPPSGSLADLLTEWRSGRKGAKSDLSVPQILQWADAHRAQHGKWPHEESGPIAGADGETWRDVHRALKQGARGLPGGSSLRKLIGERLGADEPVEQPRLSIQQVLDWADAYHERTGTWPKMDGGPVAPSSQETWQKVDKALRRGARGLPGGTSLPQLLAQRRKVRRHVRKRPLSVEQVLQWADAHHARTGKWPTNSSGAIPDAPGETWGTIAAALLRGKRNLPPRMTIAELLAQHGRKRNIQTLPDFTIRQILQWADAYHARHGKWPRVDSGPIADAPGETWCAVNVALYHGKRGLPGGSSLPRLLAAERGLHNPRQQPPLSIPQILAWADAFHQRIGEWPILDSGPVEPSSIETWYKIDKMLRRGGRGLPGGQSLLGVLSEHRGVGRHVPKSKLSVDEVLRWADAHHARTGKWPKVASGRIPEANGVSWQQVNISLLKGRRGLPSGMTISRLLAEKRGVRNIADLPKFSEAQILAWADAYHARHGEWPNSRSGKIAGAPGETWSNVQNALNLGVRGMPGGSSLAKLLAAKRGAPQHNLRPRLTIRQILAWADAFHDRMGRWPIANDGRVGPFTKETWSQIDSALRHGHRGLPGGQSLAMLMADRRRAARMARD